MIMRKRPLIITKLQLSSKMNQQLKTALDSHFTDPDKFFQVPTFNDENNTYSQIYKLTKSISTRNIPIPSRMYTKNLLSTLRRRFGHSGTSLFTIATKFSTTYSEDEMMKLYNTFKVKKNSNSCLSIHKSRNNQHKEKNALMMQENTLIRQKECYKGNNIISQKISSKINKSESDLMMNNTNDYRIKKESIVLNGKYDPICDYWKTSLRQKELPINHLKFDSNSILVNLGTHETPDYVWKTKDEAVEKIRDNHLSYEEISRDQSSFHNNKNKSMENIFIRRRKPEEVNKLEPLSIIGKDLLTQEIDMFKNMKGSRFICKPISSQSCGDNDLFGQKSKERIKNHAYEKKLMKKIISLSKHKMIF